MDSGNPLSRNIRQNTLLGHHQDYSAFGLQSLAANNAEPHYLFDEDKKARDDHDTDADQEGEARAENFDDLVKQYRCRLTRTLSRMIKNHAELEDVVQETFLKAYRSIDCFRGESSFFTWLCRIGINTAKNHLKMASRYRLAIDTDEGVSTQSLLLRDEATPEALLIGKQLKETLEQAINHLPDDLKRALWLREIEGLHYDEIAEAMNCYVGTVRSRLFRARKTIVEKIGRGIRN